MTDVRRALGLLASLSVVSLAAGCSPSDDDPLYDAGSDRADVVDTSVGCTTGVPYCSSDGQNLLRCDPATGTVSVVEACFPDRACVLGACISAVCAPGASECVDLDTQRRCRPDGSGYDELDCGADLRCNTESGACEAPCMMRIFVLIDQSGSMGSAPSSGGETKWQQARTALHTVMTSPTAADIEWGMGLFPTDRDCAIDGLVVDPVPTATAASVDAYFVSHSSPYGNTPLGFALEEFTWETASNLYDPAYHNALLVVSDGVDTCYIDCEARCGLFAIRCLLDCEAESDALVAEALVNATRTLRDARGVRTFVIGFGEGVSDSQLTAIAENGGTALGRWIQANSVDDLTAALQTIVDEMFECNPILI